MTWEPYGADETLDPEDWAGLRALGHRMLDDMFAYLETVRERPAWQPMPPEVQQAFQAPLPHEPQPAEAVYEELVRNILPYPFGNIHPRFWGWVIGTGTPVGVLAEMVAATMNPNLGGGDHAANRVELQVVDWCKEMLGFPPEASGLLVSGGSMANLIGLAVARSARAGLDVRFEGVAGVSHPLVYYGSTEMHSSLQRGVELLGLGNRYLRRIPVDHNHRIDLQALRDCIVRDKADGLRPACLIGNCGTVNAGAIDPLDALADIAAEHELWFHVDGAFGALAYLAPKLRPLIVGMKRADSLAFDLHKWGSAPIEVGCVLVRSETAHHDAFALVPDYLKHQARGAAGGPVWFSEYGLQLSRGFRALKVWMQLKTYGADHLGRIIQQNVDQADYLRRLVEQAPELELLAPVALNIVCFRFIAPDLHDKQLNVLNEELLIRIQETGVAVPSGTSLAGRYAIRCAIVNHRSRREDFDLFVEEVVRIGRALMATVSDYDLPPTG